FGLRPRGAGVATAIQVAARHRRQAFAPASPFCHQTGISPPRRGPAWTGSCRLRKNSGRREGSGMWKREIMAAEVRAVGRLLVRGTRRAARTLIGFALVLLGLAGLVLPVLPGWVFIIAGFA